MCQPAVIAQTSVQDTEIVPSQQGYARAIRGTTVQIVLSVHALLVQHGSILRPQLILPMQMLNVQIMGFVIGPRGCVNVDQVSRAKLVKTLDATMHAAGMGNALT